VHPWNGLRVVGPLGVEFGDDASQFTFRLGTSYDIEVWRRLAIAPEFNVDFSADGDQTLAYGISLVWGF
jgi:hypothetical protein